VRPWCLEEAAEVYRESIAVTVQLPPRDSRHPPARGDEGPVARAIALEGDCIGMPSATIELDDHLPYLSLLHGVLDLPAVKHGGEIQKRPRHGRYWNVVDGGHLVARQSATMHLHSRTRSTMSRRGDLWDGARGRPLWPTA
jgi:hypothetical protein